MGIMSLDQSGQPESLANSTSTRAEALKKRTLAPSNAPQPVQPSHKRTNVEPVVAARPAKKARTEPTAASQAPQGASSMPASSEDVSSSDHQVKAKAAASLARAAAAMSGSDMDDLAIADKNVDIITRRVKEEAMDDFDFGGSNEHLPPMEEAPLPIGSVGEATGSSDVRAVAASAEQEQTLPQRPIDSVDGTSLSARPSAGTNDAQPGPSRFTAPAAAPKQEDRRGSFPLHSGGSTQSFSNPGFAPASALPSHMFSRPAAGSPTRKSRAKDLSKANTSTK